MKYRLEDLLDIGPVLADRLRRASILTPAELQHLGDHAAFRRQLARGLGPMKGTTK